MAIKKAKSKDYIDGYKKGYMTALDLIHYAVEKEKVDITHIINRIKEGY